MKQRPRPDLQQQTAAGIIESFIVRSSRMVGGVKAHEAGVECEDTTRSSFIHS
jgi:hypothetical protein